MRTRRRIANKRAKNTLIIATIVASVFFVSGTYIPKKSSALTTDPAKNTVNLTVAPNISISLENSEMNLEVSPTEGKTGNIISNTISVSTNNNTGYTLSIGAKTDEVDLKHENTKYDDVIPSLEENVVVTDPTDEGIAEAFPENGWGYSVADEQSYLLFNPIPKSSELALIKNSDQPAFKDDVDIYVATNVDPDKTTGKYINTLYISAVSNQAIPTFYTISTMQEMTPEICASVPTPHLSDTAVPERSLVDVRDGNSYTIRKLYDGRCWMAQDLAIGQKNQSTLLTPQYTDIDREFILPMSSIERPESNGIPVVFIDNGVRYYNRKAATANYDYEGAFADHSICPRGWTLPKGVGEFKALLEDMGATSYVSDQVEVAFGYPFDLKKNGFVSVPELSISSKGTAAEYMLADRAGSIAYFNSSGLSIGSWSEAVNIRCIARIGENNE